MARCIVNFTGGFSGVDPPAFTEAVPVAMVIRRILRMDRDFGAVYLQSQAEDSIKVVRAATIRKWMAKFAEGPTVRSPEIAWTRCAARMHHVRRYGVIATTVLSDEEADSLATGVTRAIVNHYFTGVSPPS